MSVDNYFTEALRAGVGSSHLLLARFLCRKYETAADRQLFIFIAAVSMVLENGHLRIETDKIAGEITLLALNEYAGGNSVSEYILSILGDYKNLPDKYPLLFLPESQKSESRRAPFILSDNNRYISTEKLFSEEKRFIKNLKSFVSCDKISLPVPAISDNSATPFVLEKKQKDAVNITFRKKLSIIAGGPGTGKTTAVMSVINAHLIAGKAAGNPVKIAIAAPTGRAVKRIEDLFEKYMLTDRLDRPKTLHSLLRIWRMSKPVILPYDIVIVDECSMIDITIMNRLFESLSQDCSLVLVGDPDQLPSVGAGSVFSDIIDEIEKPGHFLGKSFVRLDAVKRSDREISDFAEMIRKGENVTGKVLTENSCLEIKPLSIADILDTITGLYESSTGSIEEMLSEISAFAVLTPTNSGPFGMETLNRKISQKKAYGKTALYDNMPLMITKNDYENDLFNGERGIVFSDKNLFYCMFRKGEGNYRVLPVAALKEWETSYVQTIHKSQGNEFDKVIIIIDSFAERILTREILYTAVTRARSSIIIFSDPEIIGKAVKNKVVRNSGISRLMFE